MTSHFNIEDLYKTLESKGVYSEDIELLLEINRLPDDKDILFVYAKLINQVIDPAELYIALKNHFEGNNITCSVKVK